MIGTACSFQSMSLPNIFVFVLPEYECIHCLSVRFSNLVLPLSLFVCLSNHLYQLTFSDHLYRFTFSDQLYQFTFIDHLYQFTIHDHLYQLTFSDHLYQFTFIDHLYQFTFSGHFLNGLFQHLCHVSNNAKDD